MCYHLPMNRTSGHPPERNVRIALSAFRVVDALDAVVEFQQDEQVMSDPLAEVIRDPSSLPEPSPVRTLPRRTDPGGHG